ncbi:ABC transporter transmembrane domain-containing protein [Anaeromassilibacillus sp. An200]|uniref:ABC transporter transmembrane domain-containing protein n=1 Tax=Anaeromassilibacillus sp. An200 TaxID=1965587 RepID=UPI00111DE2B9
MFVSILSSVSSITSILMPMYVIDAVLSDDIFNVIKVIFVFTIILLSIWVINIIFSWYDKVKMERLHISILSELMQKTINLDLSFFDNTTSYDKYNRAYANCCNVVNSVNSIISTFILSLTNTLLISSLLVWMDLYMYLLMFATIFLNLILTNLIKKRDYVYNFKVSEKTNN